MALPLLFIHSFTPSLSSHFVRNKTNESPEVRVEKAQKAKSNQLCLHLLNVPYIFLQTKALTLNVALCASEFHIWCQRHRKNYQPAALIKAIGQVISTSPSPSPHAACRSTFMSFIFCFCILLILCFQQIN